jgi:hypothetical protein
MQMLSFRECLGLDKIDRKYYGYSSFKSSPKELVTTEGIGAGQIKLEHLDPALYQEIRAVQLHNHSGAKSRRLDLKNLEGAFGISGFLMYSSDGTKRYRVTINSSTNAFVLTQV